MKKRNSLIALALLLCGSAFAQKVNDVSTPLHLLQPEYPTPYAVPALEALEQTLDRIYEYLNAHTPPKLIDKESGKELGDYSKVTANTIMQPGDFRLTSYEWGVTYAGMLLAAEQTGNAKYATYVTERLNFLARALDAFAAFEKKNPGVPFQLKHTLHPHALDDCGAICAAMIKATRTGKAEGQEAMIKNYIDYISNQEFRLSDGTLARNRPQPNSIWLDDLFMAVPALAQMGAYSGNTSYYDDAAKQVLQFAQRMFNHDKGLFMHGWVEGMDEHPQFHWARANGWAVMTMVELLEVLPANHAHRAEILDLLRKHIRGLANYQDGTGFWHQLIDRNDTYLETSATAIYVYSIARAVNRAYVDAKVYGPMLCLAWNAVATKVNAKGEVEGTCVGTGMGFDPAFYYYRPINVYAAHGYGPVLLAGAEMIELVKRHKTAINDSSVQFYDK